MPTDLLAQRWYLLGAPWATSDYAGTVILAGSEDPHIGTVVCDTYDAHSDDADLDAAREVAAHIVELHNANLGANREKSEKEADQ